MRVLAFLPVVAAVTSTHEQIASMKATLRGVAAGEINAATKASIQSFMDIMNRTLVGALVNEAADHQVIMNARRASVEACQNARTGAFNGAIHTAASTRDTARSTHMQCKRCTDDCGGAMLAQWPSGHNYSYDVDRHWGKQGQTEPAVYDMTNSYHAAKVAGATCGGGIDGEKGAWETQDGSCETLDNHAKSLFDVLLDTPNFCAETQTDKPADRPHNTEATRAYYDWEATDGDDVFVWFSHMDSMNASHTTRYKDQREDCHMKRNIHQHKTKECHRLQLIFEQDYCSWSNAIDTACHVYEGCYRSAHLSWDAQKVLTEAVEAQLKLQQAALECALCYGGQILQDSTDLDQCDRNVGCVNCDPLIIDYPAPHTFIPCSEAQIIKPCTDDYKTQEYACLSGTQWLPNDCQACSDASLPAWPTNASSYVFPVGGP